MTPRDRATRKADSLALLATPAIDAWIASASSDGPYLVPLSLAWIAERAVIAVKASSLTARNIVASGRARLGVGPTRDVVIIDALLERTVEAGTDDALASAYAAQADWDPPRPATSTSSCGRSGSKLGGRPTKPPAAP